MPTQLDIDKIIADNPSVDKNALREGEKALHDLQRTGAVKRSTYGLNTPESKRELRPSEEQETPDCLPSFRRLH